MMHSNSQHCIQHIANITGKKAPKASRKRREKSDGHGGAVRNKKRKRDERANERHGRDEEKQVLGKCNVKKPISILFHLLNCCAGYAVLTALFVSYSCVIPISFPFYIQLLFISLFSMSFMPHTDIHTNIRSHQKSWFISVYPKKAQTHR